MDKFRLVTKGYGDSHIKGTIRVPPSTYEKVYELKQLSGLSIGAVIEQCVDFALDHMDGRDRPRLPFDREEGAE